MTSIQTYFSKKVENCFRKSIICVKSNFMSFQGKETEMKLAKKYDFANVKKMPKITSEKGLKIKG